jgi:hypothetical protein
MRFRLVVVCVCVFAAVMLAASHAGAQDLCFNPPVNYPVGWAPSSVLAADLDEDGDADLVVVCTSSDNSDTLIPQAKTHFAGWQWPSGRRFSAG